MDYIQPFQIDLDINIYIHQGNIIPSIRSR